MTRYVVRSQTHMVDIYDYEVDAERCTDRLNNNDKLDEEYYVEET